MYRSFMSQMKCVIIVFQSTCIRMGGRAAICHVQRQRGGGLCCIVTLPPPPPVYKERDSAICTFQEHTHAHEHEHTHTHELTHTHTSIPSAISVGFAVAVVCRARGNRATAFFSADGTLPQFFSTRCYNPCGARAWVYIFRKMREETVL